MNILQMEVSPQQPMEDTSCVHELSNRWTLWGHLPHDTNWTIRSYIFISTFRTVEDAILVTESLPPVLVENCMLFLVKEGIQPLWEDPMNKNGGYFSYKVTNKNVHTIWKELTYATIGGTLSKNTSFIRDVTGITISPKKNFCVIKVWMTNCNHQNPSLITNEIKGLSAHGCLFNKHSK